MEPFNFVWVIFIVVMAINGAILWMRAQKHIAAHPEKREGYQRLIAGFVIVISFPFLVMGLGEVLGGVAVSDLHYPNTPGIPGQN